MLSYLHIKNIAIIDDLEIDLDRGLTILTGETGAGKSIIIGAINFVLGDKSKKEWIKAGAEEAFVEAVFDLFEEAGDDSEIEGLCQEQGIAFDRQLIISRKTAVGGRSVFRVNGVVVRQEIVQQLAKLLIDIHSQLESQSLLKRERQLKLLDRFGGAKLEQLQADYQVEYNQWNQLKKMTNTNFADEAKRKQEIDFLEFEIDQIESAGLIEGEDQELERKYHKLSHIKQIMVELSAISNQLEEGSFSSVLARGLSNLSHLTQYDHELDNIVEYLAQLEDMTSQISRDISKYLDFVDDYEEELAITEQRLNIINKLKSKYGNSVTEIMAYLQELIGRRQQLIDYEAQVTQLNQKITDCQARLKTQAESLTKQRQTTAKQLSQKITAAIKDLNLADTVFDIQVGQRENYTLSGMDEAEFYISTNKNIPLKPLAEVASGGELSRVMLAIKSVLASVDAVDTLVFDEIDTGVSGATAQKVGIKMKQLAKKRQIISITHLPQIAAMAQSHFLISKQATHDMPSTGVFCLTEEQSIQELARMLSGQETTEIALANARQMKELANKYD